MFKGGAKIMANNINEIISSSRMFYKNEKEIQQQRLTLIRNSFKYHYEHSSGYREICNRNKVTPDLICDYDDLLKIPMSPIEIFKIKDKREKLLSVPMKDIVMTVESSGTSGVSSIAYKDLTTAARDAITMISQYKEFLPEIFGGFGIIFCVPVNFMPTLGIMKLIGQLNICLNNFEYLINDPKKGPEYDRILNTLLSDENQLTRHLIGAPYLIYDFLQYLKTNYPGKKFTLDSKSLVVTIGGWKRRAGEDVCTKEEFNRMINDIFDIPDSRIRDMYAMAESNIFIIECEYQNKHVPPWAYFSIRDFEDPKNIQVPVGEEGLVAFYDSLNTAYPGFIISGDVAEIVCEGRCKCGRYSQILKFHRRAVGAEMRSCSFA